MSTRLQRVEELLRRAVADILLRGDLRDPRLSNTAAISITAVRVSADLSSARVFVDLLDPSLDRERVLKALNSASHAFRGKLGAKIRLKRTPALRFEHDQSITHGQRIEQVLEEIHAEEASELDPADTDDTDTQSDDGAGEDGAPS